MCARVDGKKVVKKINELSPLRLGERRRMRRCRRDPVCAQGGHIVPPSSVESIHPPTDSLLSSCLPFCCLSIHPSTSHPLSIITSILRLPNYPSPSIQPLSSLHHSPSILCCPPSFILHHPSMHPPSSSLPPSISPSLPPSLPPSPHLSISPSLPLSLPVFLSPSLSPSFPPSLPPSLLPSPSLCPSLAARVARPLPTQHAGCWEVKNKT